VILYGMPLLKFCLFGFVYLFVCLKWTLVTRFYWNTAHLMFSNNQLITFPLGLSPTRLLPDFTIRNRYVSPFAKTITNECSDFIRDAIVEVLFIWICLLIHSVSAIFTFLNQRCTVGGWVSFPLSYKCMASC
jgi:hypothetical protein